MGVGGWNGSDPPRLVALRECIAPRPSSIHPTAGPYPFCYHPLMVPAIKPLRVDTADGVRRAAEEAASAGRFALDTEADSLHSYFHKVCLIQMSVGSRHFVVDPLPLEPSDLDPLWRVVANPAATVIMHGADYDVRVLDRDYGAHIGRLEDTQIMALLLGEQRTGLAFLLERELGVELDKRHQRADWGARPLGAELIAYAAADTAYLEQLAARFRERLERLGRWTWAEEECARLAAVRHEAPEPDPVAFERIKGARALKGRDRDRLYELFQWRDEEARRLDIPPFKVLGSRPMLELAQKPPNVPGEVARIPGLGHRFARRWGAEVIRRLKRPRAAPPRVRGARTPQLAAAQRRRAQKLSEVRDAVAAELELAPGLICPRATIQAIAASPNGERAFDTADLAGWRRELLADRFASAMEDE